MNNTEQPPTTMELEILNSQALTYLNKEIDNLQNRVRSIESNLADIAEIFKVNRDLLDVLHEKIKNL